MGVLSNQRVVEQAKVRKLELNLGATGDDRRVRSITLGRSIMLPGRRLTFRPDFDLFLSGGCSRDSCTKSPKGLTVCYRTAQLPQSRHRTGQETTGVARTRLVLPTVSTPCAVLPFCKSCFLLSTSYRAHMPQISNLRFRQHCTMAKSPTHEHKIAEPMML